MQVHELTREGAEREIVIVASCRSFWPREHLLGGISRSAASDLVLQTQRRPKTGDHRGRRTIQIA